MSGNYYMSMENAEAYEKAKREISGVQMIPFSIMPAFAKDAIKVAADEQAKNIKNQLAMNQQTVDDAIINARKGDPRAILWCENSGIQWRTESVALKPDQVVGPDVQPYHYKKHKRVSSSKGKHGTNYTPPKKKRK
jgi:hypothetical protein